MPRTRANPYSHIAQEDLAYALLRLVSLRKVSERQIRALINERTARLAELEAELAVLRGGAAAVRRGPGRPRGTAATRKAGRRPPTRTGKMIASRKRQGRYLGLRRGLPRAQQQQATKIAQAQGVEAALKFIETQLKKAA